MGRRRRGRDLTDPRYSQRGLLSPADLEEPLGSRSSTVSPLPDPYAEGGEAEGGGKEAVTTRWIPTEPDLEPSAQVGSSWQSYRRDLRQSAGAFRHAPGLVVVTGGIAIIYAVTIVGRIGVVAFGIWLLLLGVIGLQRVWFVRAFRGDTMTTPELWRLTRAFFGRFASLGALLLVPFAALVIVLVATGQFHVVHGKVGTTTTVRGSVDAAVIGFSLILDALLTFVVPALALSVRSPDRALRMGLRMIRQTWPQSGWYVLAPGLTVTLVSVVMPRSVVGPWAFAAVGVVGSVLALWFKGAIVAFYLRCFPDVSENGSAYE